MALCGQCRTNRVALNFLLRRYENLYLIRKQGAVSVAQAKAVQESPKASNQSINPLSAVNGSTQTSPRINVARIQMIPESQRQALFSASLSELDPPSVLAMVTHLKSKGLWGFQPQILPEPKLNLPKLLGGSIDEHFRLIAEEQIRPYVVALDNLLGKDTPPLPNKWIYKAGWTKYENDGHTCSVDYPDADALVFDIETCLSEGKYATLAAAASSDHWYTWCSSHLVDGTPEEHTAEGRLKLEYLIPLETTSNSVLTTPWRKERLVIGHNVSFDRSYIREQYFMDQSKMRFLDTMSLHIALAGFTTSQRAVYMKQNAKAKREPEEEAKAEKKTTKRKGKFENTNTRRWLEVGSMNNLEDVYKLHCGVRLPYDKSLSGIFVNGKLDDVRDNFEALMTYCANDVRATYRLAQKLIPKYREALPHPVTFGGLLEMSSVYLPVNKNWETYIEKSNKACDQIEDDLRKGLVKLAVEALENGQNEAYKDDLWLWDLDWSSQKVTSRTKNVALASLPKWYRDLSKTSETVDANGLPVPQDVSLRMRIAPKLMRLTWNGWPLHHTAEHGWGWLEPAPGSVPPPVVIAVTEAKKEKAIKKTKKTATAADAEEVEKAPKKSTKSVPDAVFPLHRLLELAKELGRPVNVVSPKIPAFSTPEPTSSNVTDDEWERLNDMTPSEQQDFFLQRTDISGYADLMKPIPRKLVKDLPSETAHDQELSRYFSEDVEQQEFQAKYQSWKAPRQAQTKQLNPVELNEYLDVIPGCIFRRLTHSNGIEYNVGSPLSRDFLQYFESGILKASFGSASDIIRLSKAVSYWHNNKDRVESQLVGDLEPRDMPATGNLVPPVYRPEDRYGAILPRIAYMGTVTRRAVEATWMTASNAKPDRIGSELKAMIQAPPGYNIVGADVDSQELWIAAILGDANWLKEHGCTAFGWMTLQGNKADGTDLHSKTAVQAGVGRDHAKILNYGRIYGAGRDYAAVLLRNFNHDLTEGQALGKAQKIYSFSKGHRQYQLNAMGKYLAIQCGLTEEEAEAMFKFSSIKEIYEMTSGRQIDPNNRREYSTILAQLTEGASWVNGSESYMFNQLETIARSDEPRTPVLGCRISRCLLKENVEDDFMTSRVNWVVQSSAVDYLHLMLVCMKWLMTKYNIRGRFCLSIHDEVRYLVEECDRDRAVLALHLTNLLTRAMFAHKLGMHDLPLSIAYFSAVDVDTVIRKDASIDCVTPSNPEGLEKAYGIPKGEALTVFDAVSRTGGHLESV